MKGPRGRRVQKTRAEGKKRYSSARTASHERRLVRYMKTHTSLYNVDIRIRRRCAYIAAKHASGHIQVALVNGAWRVTFLIQ